jgi:hypothetical protein
MMCDKIRRFGLSDSAAAEHVGMSSSTIARWKQLYPEIAPKLQQARQEIRIHHLEIIEQAAAAENGRGWRASAWILERLFPADYARKISERFAALNLEDRLKDREAHAALEVRLQELHAMQDAERAERAAAAQEAAARAAAEAEAHARQGVGAADQQAGGIDGEAPTPPAEAPRVYSGGDSHNSRKSGRGDEPAPLHDPAVQPGPAKRLREFAPSTGSGPSALKVLPIIPEIRASATSRPRSTTPRTRLAPAKRPRGHIAERTRIPEFPKCAPRRFDRTGCHVRKFRQLPPKNHANPFGNSGRRCSTRRAADARRCANSAQTTRRALDPAEQIP